MVSFRSNFVNHQDYELLTDVMEMIKTLANLLVWERQQCSRLGSVYLHGQTPFRDLAFN